MSKRAEAEEAARGARCGTPPRTQRVELRRHRRPRRLRSGNCHARTLLADAALIPRGSHQRAASEGRIRGPHQRAASVAAPMCMRTHQWAHPSGPPCTCPRCEQGSMCAMYVCMCRPINRPPCTGHPTAAGRSRQASSVCWCPPPLERARRWPPRVRAAACRSYSGATCACP